MIVRPRPRPAKPVQQVKKPVCCTTWLYNFVYTLYVANSAHSFIVAAVIQVSSALAARRREVEERLKQQREQIKKQVEI